MGLCEPERDSSKSVASLGTDDSPEERERERGRGRERVRVAMLWLMALVFVSAIEGEGERESLHSREKLVLSGACLVHGLDGRTAKLGEGST